MTTPPALSCAPAALYGGRAFWRDSNLLNNNNGSRPTAWYFGAGMSICADGSPHAYHPESAPGLDSLANAGSPGGWWGIATVDGEPVIQGPGDPAPGYYVSTTALIDPARPETSPARYLDAEIIPYVVVPPGIFRISPVRLGDLAWVWRPSTGAGSGAIIGETGPANRIGEGSIALARALDVPSDARRGGTGETLIWLIFPGSGRRRPLPPAVITEKSLNLMNLWGGEDRLFALLRKLTDQKEQQDSDHLV